VINELPSTGSSLILPHRSSTKKRDSAMKNLLLALLLLAPLTLAGCGATDFTQPNDAYDAQQFARENRGIPKATEMPPGLGEDLPATAPAVTQPQPK